MPYCNIKTTVKVEKKKELSKELTKVIGLIPGKTENWVMTSIDDEAVMTFAGTDEPCALITLKTYGEPAQTYYDMVTRGFTDTVSKILGIRPDRIYVDHESIEHWGWNDKKPGRSLAYEEQGTGRGFILENIFEFVFPFHQLFCIGTNRQNLHLIGAGRFDDADHKSPGDTLPTIVGADAGMDYGPLSVRQAKLALADQFFFLVRSASLGVCFKHDGDGVHRFIIFSCGHAMNPPQLFSYLAVCLMKSPVSISV